jgi:enoyl-CoA hydratase
MREFETLLIEDRGPIRIITINRPKVLNALNPTVVAELYEALAMLQGEHAGDVRGVILCGAGEKAFVAGADIASMVEMSEDDAMTFGSSGHAVGDLIANLPVPVMAAVQGFALGGGCELALACDFIYASAKARFGQPEVKLGVIPGFGGSQRLLRRVGLARAMELCMTGETIDAERAFALGLVNKIVAPEGLMDAAVKTMEAIAAMGPRAIAKVKRVMHEGAERPLEAANQLEVEGFAALFNTDDQTEGMRAFMDKRGPKFKNS